MNNLNNILESQSDFNQMIGNYTLPEQVEDNMSVLEIIRSENIEFEDFDVIQNFYSTSNY